MLGDLDQTLAHLRLGRSGLSGKVDEVRLLNFESGELRADLLLGGAGRFVVMLHEFRDVGAKLGNEPVRKLQLDVVPLDSRFHLTDLQIRFVAHALLPAPTEVVEIDPTVALGPLKDHATLSTVAMTTVAPQTALEVVVPDPLPTPLLPGQLSSEWASPPLVERHRHLGSTGPLDRRSGEIRPLMHTASGAHVRCSSNVARAASHPNLVAAEPTRRDRLLALMVAELDARRLGNGQVDALRWPEDEERNQPAVELLGRTTVGEVVVEHTRIESYEGQIQDVEALQRIFGIYGGPNLPHRAEAGKFALGLPPGAAASVPFKLRNAFNDFVAYWVDDRLDLVPRWPIQPGTPVFLEGSDERFSFSWTLFQCLPLNVDLVGPLATALRVSIRWDTTSEGPREIRVSRAIAAKVPKLLRAAGDMRRSILVIEDRDTILSSPLDVRRAIRVATTGYEFLPSAIYLVHTGMGDPLLLPILVDGVWDESFDWQTFPVERAAAMNATWR